MIVLSNIFRGSHSPQQLPSELAEKSVKEKQSNLVSQSSLRLKQRTKTHDNINETLKNENESKTSVSDKRLSNSVDAIVTHKDAKSKVICSAKGLLETNLDDLFNDVQKIDGWAVEPKSLGASEPTLSFNQNHSRAVSKRESLMSENDSDGDTATDSDYMDDAAREQRKCMGARRFGHMLRRVLSRNGLTNKQLAALKAAENLELTCNACANSPFRKSSFIVPSDDEEEEDPDDSDSGLSHWTRNVSYQI
ncbi:jg18085 [Pararge aegeria aegeria]|uniref:Jg18085 protein n=1 Tax=Pararge aegeria aegeria TaxID=348720 RepID=A0A8S4RU60_9NEOP|nr:jg18085 [Pararge aegeria aegeria]